MAKYVGGSAWIREDTIPLKNIELQSAVPDMDLSAFEGNGIDQVNKGINLLTQQLCNDEEEAEDQKRNLKGKTFFNIFSLRRLRTQLLAWVYKK